MVGCLAMIVLAASVQLEALKNEWAAETIDPLPQDRAAWEAWRQGDLSTLREQVARAEKMKPFLATRFNEGTRRDLVVVAIGGSGEALDSIWLTQGRHYAAMGFSVLMVENPSDDIARLCLERNTSWLAYGTAALQRELPKLRTDYAGILWSGFSLGTELMMSTASLNRSPHDLFVYNDFLCRSKERLIVMDREPNGLRNITPGYFVRRDFPERMLALSDCPILFTEGGLDRDFAIVRSIFPENVTCHHQPRFAEVKRFSEDKLPRPLSQTDYFRLCNVDPANHFFKFDLVKKWLEDLAKRELPNSEQKSV